MPWVQVFSVREEFFAVSFSVSSCLRAQLLCSFLSGLMTRVRVLLRVLRLRDSKRLLVHLTGSCLLYCGLTHVVLVDGAGPVHTGPSVDCHAGRWRHLYILVNTYNCKYL